MRQLERELGKLLRKTATRIASGTSEAPVAIDIEVVRDALGRQRFFREAAERTAVPGVATGLAVTGVGGDVLFVEATSVPGGEKLVLTGQLGDVMKESAQIALSAVRARAGDYGLEDEQFENRSFHVHVPAGRDPEGRPERRDHDGDGVRVAADRPPGQAHRRDDGRGHPAGPGAPDRWAEAEGSRRSCGRADGRRDSRAQPRRPGRRATARAGRDVVPPRDVALRGARARARAGRASASMSRCRHCAPVPEGVRQAAGLLEGAGRSRSSGPPTRGHRGSTSSSRRWARSHPARSPSGSSSSRRRACSSGSCRRCATAAGRIHGSRPRAAAAGRRRCTRALGGA